MLPSSQTKAHQQSHNAIASPRTGDEAASAAVACKGGTHKKGGWHQEATSSKPHAATTAPASSLQTRRQGPSHPPQSTPPAHRPRPTVAEVGRDDQLALLAHAHALHAFVPACGWWAGRGGQQGSAQRGEVCALRWVRMRPLFAPLSQPAVGRQREERGSAATGAPAPAWRHPGGTLAAATGRPSAAREASCSNKAEE